MGSVPMRAKEDFDSVMDLLATGLSAGEVVRRTGVAPLLESGLQRACWNWNTGRV
jgi:hypothetical protein